MRKTIWFVLLLIPIFSNAQNNLLVEINQNTEAVTHDFEVKDYPDKEKSSVTKLRQYLENKDKQLNDLEEKLLVVNTALVRSSIDSDMAQKLLLYIDSAKKIKIAEIDERTKAALKHLGFAKEIKDFKKVAELDIIYDEINDRLTDYLIAKSLNSKLNKYKNIIKADISQAHKRIDVLYSSLYDEGQFRGSITVTFSLIIGSLLLMFFLFINHRIDTPLAKEFLSSGNGLQFIALFSLIIAIILFGVLGILEGKELAAILSGISGFILGKGIHPPVTNGGKGKKEMSTENEKTTG